MPGQPGSLKWVYLSGAGRAKTKVTRRTESTVRLVKRMILSSIDKLVFAYSRGDFMFFARLRRLVLCGLGVLRENNFQWRIWWFKSMWETSISGTSADKINGSSMCNRSTSRPLVGPSNSCSSGLLASSLPRQYQECLASNSYLTDKTLFPIRPAYS